MNKASQPSKPSTAETNDNLLAQWQTCVEMANAVSERRDTMNNLFVTLNLAIIAAISYMWDIKTVGLLIAGIVVCIVWMLFIRNFRELNRAKFEVINAIEQQLPVKAFCNEWQHLKKAKKYIEGTKLEKSLPISFVVLYGGILILIIITTFQGGGA